MDLTGKLKGSYTYGEGYPPSIRGNSSPFELLINDNDGFITGVCVDEVVKGKTGNTSAINGTFADNFISFIKTYKYTAVFDENMDRNYEDEDLDNQIHYTGQLFKKFFSRAICFKGEWVISTAKNTIEGKYLSVAKGSWKMKKIS